jgi:hypothetical protein
VRIEPWNWKIVTPLLLASASATFAQTDVSLLLNNWHSSTTVEAHGDAMLFPNAHYADQGSIQMTEVEAAGRYRITSDLQLNPTVGYDWTLLDMTGKRGLIPQCVQDLSIAAATPLIAVDQGFIGALVGVGYAGDEAFGDDSGWYGKADLMYGRTINKNSDLLLFVEYDGNRTLLPDVPIPGIEYSNHALPNFSFIAGFPESSISYTILPPLKLSATWDFPYTFSGDLKYSLSRSFTLFVKYVDEENAFHTEYLDSDRRLFFQQQRVEAGMTYHCGSSLEFLLGAGYAFSREFSTGFDDRNRTGTGDIADAPYLRAGVTIRF